MPCPCGVEIGEKDGDKYTAFETYVGSEIWRLRFTIRSKATGHAKLRKTLYEFVPAVPPGAPARELVN
ncbi:MAG: hypothetical protein C4340_01960 [Armatimonadota bacterium]|mgnify:CR=1 FL=1